MALFTWGLGKSGQLGNGRNENCELPSIFEVRKRRQNLATEKEGSAVDEDTKLVDTVGAGALFTAWAKDGLLFVSGCGKYGRLGTGNEHDISIPESVDIPGVRVSKVSCGSWHACALTDQGKLYSWGYGKSHGVLGTSEAKMMGGVYSMPVNVAFPANYKIVGVSAGHNFTLAWDGEGNAYSWGSNHNGVLGQGNTKDLSAPTQIEALRRWKVTHMAAGHSHAVAVIEDGRMFTFGKGKNGALGLGSKMLKDVITPTQVDAPGLINVVRASCSVGEHHGHTLAVTKDGEVFSWGDGYKGKLGIGNQESHAVPVQIPKESFSGEMITSVSAGGIHSAAVSREGHVFTWGCGSDGRLGHPEAKGHRYLFRSDTPRMVDALRETGKAVSVKASYYHTIVLLS